MIGCLGVPSWNTAASLTSFGRFVGDAVDCVADLGVDTGVKLWAVYAGVAGALRGASSATSRSEEAWLSRALIFNIFEVEGLGLLSERGLYCQPRSVEEGDGS